MVPDGFVVPPLLYLVVVLAVTGAVAVLLLALRPPVTRGTVVALVPWIVVGSSLHVLYVLDAISGVTRPLFGTPTVYLTTFAVAGGCWAGLTAIGVGQKAERRIAVRLGGIGTGVALVLVTFVGLIGLRSGGLDLATTLIVAVATVVIWIVAWFGLSLTYTTAVAKTGIVGSLVVLGHVLDGVTTAIGVDLLGVGERSPLPRLIMEQAGRLPWSDVVGVGWAFVGVKVVLAVVIVALMADYVEESPAEGRLLLAGLAAVGLGPGVHNLLLFLAGV